jgi:prepilin-type N-terminal cleavage/methylation domain-containing protein
MRIRSWSPHVRCSGFTLIEILVVLGLLGIGYALSAPSFRRTRRESVNGVQEVIDATRRIALRRGGAVRVCFEPGGPWRVESGTEKLVPSSISAAPQYGRTHLPNVCKFRRWVAACSNTPRAGSLPSKSI